ncbi:MAG TPA: DUF72 domain-containing protein [Candidatus Sulfotelmatobacter sp.]|nr:DUF72 domain-containing protein [Candidatus Sulfotelmatobacter sp.]
MTERVWIGTSGWHYKHWKGNFYPEKISGDAMLPYYAARLNSVELNNSFYRLPTEQAVETWVRQTPPDFLFSLKASRYITHLRKLLKPEDSIARFMTVAEGFGEKLGPILFQFPATWRINDERLQEFLRVLPPKRKYAFEFRHSSWHTAEVRQTLAKFNAAVCVFEIAGSRCPVDVTADFVYIRLHGPGKAYQGKYSDEALAWWAEKIQNWAAQGLEVFIYFDNDQAGFAAQNAVALCNAVFGPGRCPADARG